MRDRQIQRERDRAGERQGDKEMRDRQIPWEKDSKRQTGKRERETDMYRGRERQTEINREQRTHLHTSDTGV